MSCTSLSSPCVVLQGLRAELLVEQRTAGAGVIHLGHRTEHGGRPMPVRALDRRNALR